MDVLALRAIADPRRQDILRMVLERELPAGEIAARFDVTRPAISQHLRVLVNARLISVRKEGTRRLYRSRPEGITELKAFLDEFWGERLQALKQAAEKEEQRKGEHGGPE
jgi:DNA-binding transcriptional ArsR family regulator